MAWTKADATNKTDALMFRELSDEEEERFVAWADNHPEEASDNKVGTYHPVIINRWREKGLI